MDATLIVIDSDAELARAMKRLDALMESDDPGKAAQAAAQARLIEAYEQTKWPVRMPRTADVIRYLMAEHDHGATVARAVRRAGRCAAAAREGGEAAGQGEAEGSVNLVGWVSAEGA